jgi:FimV-like protein
LNSATFKVTTDAKGRPVLAIRSSESFSEPLIDLVVDLRWRNGQLIRQYSLLLDPAGFPAAPQAAAALPVPPAQAALPQTVITSAVSPASSPADPSETPTGSVPAAAADGAVATSRSAQVSTRTMTQLKVGARATLRGVAWRVGARSKNDLNQMMIAIFRANPSAFDGNINRLRLGAILRIPSAEEAAAIPYSEANRETRAQMKTWLASVKRPGSNPVSTVAETAPQPASQTTPGAAAADTAPSSTASASTAPANAPLASAPVAGAYSVSPAGSSAATSGQAAAPAPAATSGDAAGEKAALTTQLLSLEGNLQQLQAQLEEQHNKLLTLQAQQRYAEQHTKAVAAAAVVQKSDRGPLTAALAGMAVLAAACVALLMRLRRRTNASSLPSIDKVPTLAQLEAETAAQAQKPKVTFRVPEAPRIEVQEFHEVPSDARAAAREEPIESALELSITDTSGINAAKLREELAAAKLREEIAAAWALPAAETYKREDIDHDSTLAQDIAKSLDDTVKLQQAHEGGDTIEEANSYIETIVGAAGDTGNYAAATALMPAPHTEPDPIHIDPENLDFNLMDLDGPDAHVRMEGTTQEHVVVKDRRTNLVDVLKQAIEREPHRRDLRIKLLETYYAEAATNRQGFLDAVQRLAQERGQMDEAEWQKIEQMGRKLGADSPELSSPQDPNLADCA